ncbi:MAG: HemK/PrmC family methyltransferase [Flaviflexus sp.]|nr:HemK/PrmC family methyltransferase [Flaviflexus sp.]
MRWRQLLAEGAEVLAAAGIDSPQVDARLLAEHVAGTHLLLAPDPTEQQAGEVRGLIARRARRIPLQHLTGEMFFRSLTLPATPGVFICRPETELLVDEAISEIERRREHLTIVDLCTGSGAIALAIAAETGRAVTAVEIDPVPARAAAESARALGLPVTVEIADALTWGEDGSVDLLTCNPPYVPRGELPPEVQADPPRALWGGGDDGLEIPLIIIERAARLLAPGGLALIEHAESQGPALISRAAELGLDAQTLPDLAGRPRFCRARAAV